MHPLGCMKISQNIPCSHTAAYLCVRSPVPPVRSSRPPVQHDQYLIADSMLMTSRLFLDFERKYVHKTLIANRTARTVPEPCPGFEQRFKPSNLAVQYGVRLTFCPGNYICFFFIWFWGHGESCLEMETGVLLRISIQIS